MLTKYQNANSKLGLGSKPVAVIYASNKLGFFHLPVHVSFTLSKTFLPPLLTPPTGTKRPQRQAYFPPCRQKQGTIPGSRFYAPSVPLDLLFCPDLSGLGCLRDSYQKQPTLLYGRSPPLWAQGSREAASLPSSVEDGGDSQRMQGSFKA